MDRERELIRHVTEQVIRKLMEAEQELLVPVGISNRHVHLDREDMDALFGPGSELTVKKTVKQPGQFAAEQTVTLTGPRGEIGNVRILGPLRKETQVEVSMSDARKLGVDAAIRLSGDARGTPGIEITGPRGKVTKDSGVIVALRHIHMHTSMAEREGFRDGDPVDVRSDGVRAGVMSDVPLRVSDNAAYEMHIDVEEANAFSVKNGDFLRIIRKDRQQAGKERCR